MITPPQETLLQFLRQALHSTAMQQFAALILAGAIGIVAHYTMKWARNEIEGSLIDYTLRDHPRNTVYVVLSYVGFAVGTVTSGMLDGAGWLAVLTMGFTTGFSVDNIANKAARPVWSEEQRQQTTTIKPDKEST